MVTRNRPLRRALMIAALASLAAACGAGSDSEEQPEATRAEASATTALANSQGGALEVLEFVLDSGGVDGRSLPTALPATVAIDSCRQLDIVVWEVSGTVELASPEAVEGLVQFRVGSAGGVDTLVRVNHSGTYTVQVPAQEMSDLRQSCQIMYPDETGWASHAESVGVPFEGVFTWDAEPGSVASLGVGVIAGDRNDARRAWAEHHWFGQPLPFDRVLAVDRTLIGLPTLRSVASADSFESPCREIRQTFGTAEVTQRRSCPVGANEQSRFPIDVTAAWESHGEVEGLVFERAGQAFFLGSAEEWNVEIVASSIPDVITLAAALTFYDNEDQAPARTDVPSTYPLDEDDITDHVIGADFREVGRFDAAGDRFLVVEGPLNPESPSDYLRQLRVYLLDRAGRYWNPLLISAGHWNRCLGATPWGPDQTFIVTGDSGASVEAADGAEPPLAGEQGRLRLATDSYTASQLTLFIDGDEIVCAEPINATEPDTVPTTTGTTQPSTDGSVPPGSTDTTNP